MKMNAGWVGVDLDGTLAHYDKWRGPRHIGEPVEAMVERVKAWLAQGVDVRIFTARVSKAALEVNGDTLEAVGGMISAWCEKHLGQPLPVTNEKDMAMVQLWDDRAVGVEPNEGYPTDSKAWAMAKGLNDECEKVMAALGVKEWKEVLPAIEKLKK